MPIINTVKDKTNPAKRFDALFEAHHDAIFRYCVRRLGPFEAEDAAADVFAVAWRRLDEMPPMEADRAWLYGVAYRVVGNRFRSRRRGARLFERMRLSPNTEHQLDQTPSDDGLIIQALQALSATDQELLRLSSWDGLSRREIAEVLGIRENAVDQRLHRARARLKTHFDRLAAVTGRGGSEEDSA